jgi:hypothetical protein
LQPHLLHLFFSFEPLLGGLSQHFLSLPGVHFGPLGLVGFDPSCSVGVSVGVDVGVKVGPTVFRMKKNEQFEHRRIRTAITLRIYSLV